MLRAEVEQGSAIGQEIESTLAAGDLVSDELIEDLLYEPFAAASRAGGFVLDGFPRTLHQAQRAYEFASEIGGTLDAVIHLDVPTEELLRRALARGQGRADDVESTIRHRIDVYERETRPLIDYYTGRDILLSVDATGSPDEVFQLIVDRVDARVAARRA